MHIEADSVQSYLAQLPEDRREVIAQLQAVIRANLPEGFEEAFSYGMIGYVVPKSIYPNGYKPDPAEPLPFIALASQKNHVAFYHMGIYMAPELLQWFTDEYKKRVESQLDMGKSCVRFKNMKTIPYDLIGELCQKITVADYVKKYEESTAGR